MLAASWGLAIALASGCGDSTGGSAGAAVSREEIVETGLPDVGASVAGPITGDETLSIALRRCPTSLDPMSELDPWARRVVDDLVFEGLTRPVSEPNRASGSEGSGLGFAELALADHCVALPVEAPRNVWCRLRADAFFHDGSPVTAQDLEYSLKYWLDPRRSSLRRRHGLSGLRSVEVVEPSPELADAAAHGRPGATWVHLQVEHPDPMLLERIAAMKVVPQAARRGRAESFAHAPVGTGPMRVVTLQPDELVLERADPAGKLARIVLRTVSDGATALTLLRRGEVDVVAEVAPVHIPAELAKPGMAPRFSAWHLTPPWFDLIVYNLRKKPQAGARLRAALDDGLPRTQVAGLYPMPARPALAPVDVHDPVEIDLAVLEEFGVSADWGMAGLPALVEADEASIDQAGRTLDELGWKLDRGVRRKDGTSLRMTLMWNGAMGRARDMAALIKEGWGDLGVQVPYATASWSYIAGLMRKAEFEIGLARLAGPSDADLYDYFHSRGEQNWSGLSDADLDAALEAYRRAADADERRAAKQAIAARLAELQPVSVLYAPTQVMLVSRRVQGLSFVDDLPKLDELELGERVNWFAGE